MSNTDKQNPVEAIRETLNSVKTLWMRLSSMKWDTNTSNQFFYQVKKFNALIKNIDTYPETEQLITHVKKLNQTTQMMKVSGNAAAHQATMKTIFQKIFETLPDETINEDIEESGNKPIEKIKSNEVLIVSSLSKILSAQFNKSGYATRQVESLEEVAFLLTSGMPRAIVIDLHYESQSDSGINIISLFNKIKDTLPPVIFISGEDTLTNRIKAIKAGGMAYLPDPVNVPAIINYLKKGLKKPPKIPEKRILMIDNHQKEARIFTHEIERDFDARVLNKPEKTINNLKIFRPELIVMNMELLDIDGYELYQALRQHPIAENIPFILICTLDSIKDNLNYLDRTNLDLIIQPAPTEYLIWSIQQSLYQTFTIEKQLQKIDKYDKLTGLVNRHYFLKAMKDVLHSKSTPFEQSATLILVMIDNIDEIRAKTDAARADEIIKRSALAFKESLKIMLENVLLHGRFTDNTFSILCKNIHEDTLKPCITQLISKIEQAGHTQDVKIAQVDVDVCIGVSAIQTEPPKDYLELIDQAKLALLRAQKKEKDRYHILSADSGLKKVAEVPDEILDKISFAFENGMLQLVFQAISGIEQDDHKRYEVCLKLTDENGNELDSSHIFEAIEDHPLNYILDCWAIEQSLRILSENNINLLSTTLFINISPRTLQEDDFLDCYREILLAYNVSSFQFVFEFSQNTLLNYHEAVYEKMQNFKDSGCYFGLQQYEGGETVDKLLNELSFNYIKVSSTQLDQMMSDTKGEQAFKNFISEMNAKNMTIIASEIENIQLLPQICSSGIKYVQGYILHQPEATMCYDFSNGIF